MEIFPKLGVKMFKEYWNHHPENAWIKLDESNHRIQKLQVAVLFPYGFWGRFGTPASLLHRLVGCLPKMTWLQHTFTKGPIRPIIHAGLPWPNRQTPWVFSWTHTTGVLSCHVKARNPHIFGGVGELGGFKRTYPVDHGDHSHGWKIAKISYLKLGDLQTTHNSHSYHRIFTESTTKPPAAACPRKK